MNEIEQKIQKLVQEYHYKKLPSHLSKSVREYYQHQLPQWLQDIIQQKRENETALYSLDGTQICTGFTRVVIGDYGAFIEFSESQACKQNMKCEKGQEYRKDNPKYRNRVKYFWYTTKDESHCKLYIQQKGVTYADYTAHMGYVSPYDCIPYEYSNHH